MKYLVSSLLVLAIHDVAIVSSQETSIDFSSRVAPILEEHCLRCHSPSLSKGEVSLSTFADLEANGYVVPGDPAGSHLIDLVTSTEDGAAEMPQDAPPLTASEVGILTTWIREGAIWPADVIVREKSKADETWWSLQPIEPGSLQTIDEYVEARLVEKGLAMNPRADRQTLIRRATYDLIGLPPTSEEVEDFVNDPDPLAYAKLINRLLDSPHYGERWGRHWLDVVRFGESIGYERNVIVNNLWPFRDYVIQSLNEDKPFDQFIREHIAGDVFDDNDLSAMIGSAFLVAGPYDDVGNQDAEQAAQIRANTLDEIISATGQAFLGMTIGCARCHDHKFDPITQEDYYGLYATFAGVRHGEVPLATRQQKTERAALLRPLNARKDELQKRGAELQAAILERGRSRLAEYEAQWIRPKVDRTGTEESFESVEARFVRLVCEAQDLNPQQTSGFRIDEFQIWSTENNSRNVALSVNGGKATGPSRQNGVFDDAYSPRLAIDGERGARFIATSNHLTIELAAPTKINRVVFSSAHDEPTPEHSKFVFVADYRIEVSLDGEQWHTVADGSDRQPVNQGSHVEYRLRKGETTPEEMSEQFGLAAEMAKVLREIDAVPTLPRVWVGKRVAEDARGPFHVFLGGSPQKKGDVVVPASLSVLGETHPSHYRLNADAPEAERRQSLAEWTTHPTNPLTARVLVNRLWHYHFGTGIVDTPSDFGYMGGRPSHPQLLDFLATQLVDNDWRIKELHRLIMTSDAYCQSSAYVENASRIDADSRLLWRFPPRRLSAEEIRDTILSVAGELERTRVSVQEVISSESSNGPAPRTALVPDGGPGFRLYQFIQDNVCTFEPLDRHGPDTYRRAIYHQNARASVVDLMTDFDQPDCTFSAPRRAETTTPLQALTMLNHSFTLDMSTSLANRIREEAGEAPSDQVIRAYALLFTRPPSDSELEDCRQLIREFGLDALCRVLLNTSELIHIQ